MYEWNMLCLSRLFVNAPGRHHSKSHKEQETVIGLNLEAARRIQYIYTQIRAAWSSSRPNYSCDTSGFIDIGDSKRIPKNVDNTCNTVSSMADAITIRAKTKTFAQRLVGLPLELQLMIWEWVLRSPRVININFRRGSAPDLRWTWYFSRMHAKCLTYPAIFLDHHNLLNFQDIDDFNRVIKVKDGEYTISFELLHDRDIFFLRSFHRGRMFRSPSAVDTDSHRMLQLKRLRRVMVLSDEFMEIFSTMGYPEYTWCENHLFGPIGHRDCQIEEYIVLLDRPQTTDSYVSHHDLVVFSEYETLAILSSPMGVGWASAVSYPSLDTHVQRIAGAWRYWSHRGYVRLPELRFARLRQCLSPGRGSTGNL